MTGIFNYGVTALMAALGAGATFSVLIKTVVIPLAADAGDGAGHHHRPGVQPDGHKSLLPILSSAAFWEGQALVLAKMLLTRGAGAAVGGSWSAG